MSLPLADLNSNFGLWLEVLIDDELSPAQRIELIDYLDASPHQWRACAVALMDQQTFSAEFRKFNSASTVNVEAKKTNVSPFQTSKTSWIVGLAASIFALVAGYAIGQRVENNKQLAVMTELQSIQSNVNQLSGFLISQQQVATRSKSLESIYPDHPMLIEIEDSNEKAIFLTDRKLSESMLEAFISAGHEVDVSPYQPRLMTRQMRSLENPVIAVEVTKYQPVMLIQGNNQ